MLALLALGFEFGNLQRNGIKIGRTDPTTHLVRSALSPISVPSHAATFAVSDFLTGVFYARKLTNENRHLREQAAIINMYSETVDALQREIEEKRLLLNLQQSASHPRVVANVIGYTQSENRLLLDIGSDKGVIAGLAVESGRGLVGTIESVEKHRSTVLLVTSRNQVGAIDSSRNPAPVGLMRGRDSNTVEVTFSDPKAPVQVGDLIVTSGLGIHIPRGIVIGRVMQVDSSEEYGFKKAIVDPVVSVGMLREVLVLR